MHSLTRDELAALLTAAKKHSQRDYVMVLVGFYHGMRASEVCGLTAEHIRDGYIRVERLKGSETNIQEAHPDVIAYAKSKTGLLFGIKRRQFFNVIRKHCVTAGIPEHLAHPHTLRHTCCSLMLDGGAKINEVQKRAGHRSLSSTGRYLSVSDAVASRAFQSAVGDV
jgi:integrase